LLQGIAVVDTLQRSSFESTNASTNCFLKALGAMFLIFLIVDRAAKHDDTVLVTFHVSNFKMFESGPVFQFFFNMEPMKEMGITTLVQI